MLQRPWLTLADYHRPMTQSFRLIRLGGAADRCGDLEVGDVILAANSRPLSGMTRPEAWQFLKTLPQGVVIMNIRRKSYKF